MSKIQKSAEELLAGIVSNPTTENSVKSNEKTETKSTEKSTQKTMLDKPQTLSIVLNGETFAALFNYVNEKKLAGERGYSMSKICRIAIEDWVKQNL